MYHIQVSYKALQFMEANTINYANTWRQVERSTRREYYLTDLDYDYLLINKLVPTGNTMVASSGHYIHVPAVEPYFMFRTDKILYSEEESAARATPIVESIYDRAMRNYKALSVFVNGRRVPDKLVYVYAFQGGTDVFIPKSSFNQTAPNTLVCTVHDYSDRSYYNYCEPRYEGGLTIGPFSIPTHAVPMDKNFLSVFVNGDYIEHGAFDYTLDDQLTVTITLHPEAVSNSAHYSFEILIDTSTIGRHTDYYEGTDGNLYCYIPKGSQSLIETAVFYHMLNLYINGRRIPIHELEQLTYRHFLVKTYSQDTPVERLEFAISDTIMRDIPFSNYRYHIMEFEKWVSDEQAIVKMIAGDYSGSAMYPPFILRERLAFPPRNSYIIDSDVTRSLRYNIRASQMVQENTHYFRNLLTFYGITEEVYTVNRGNAGGANRFVRIKLDNDDQDYRNKNTRLIELFINDKKIPNVDIFQVSQYGMDIIKIPLSKFRVNETDIIKIHKYPVINAHQKYYRFNVREFATLYTDEFTEVSSISSLYGDLGYYDDIEDLEVFIEGTSETMRNSIQLHVPGASLYYRKVPKNDANYTLRLMRSPVTGDDALCLKIPSGSCIPNNTNIMIVNPLFHTSKTFNLTELASSTDCRIALNEVQNGVAIPFTTGRFLVKVYLNGKLLMNGYDYREVNQDTHDGIGSASIVFSKRLVRGDRVEVVCTGTGNKVIATYPVIPRENIFGYIYFATLPVPFSLKYLSLMVNGIMLTEDDVEVYTDRLIRLKGRAKPPFYSVILLTRLKYGLGAFERYIGDFLHYPNPFDSYMRTLSHNIIYDAIDLSGEENNGNILDIIHDDSTLTDEEETLLNDYENGAYVPPEVEPWDADHISYMDRLAWDFNRNANEISKYFDSNYYKKITSDAYVVSLLALVDRDLLKTHSIVLDANGHRGIMRENFVADANRYARTKHKTAQLITRLIKQHSIPTLDANMTYEQYEHPLFRKYLYPFDAVCFDANICTKDYNIAQHIVADANSVSEPV